MTKTSFNGGRRLDLLIGVGRYSDPMIPAIPCCENDIDRLGCLLSTIPYINGSDPIQTVVSTKNGLETANNVSILNAMDSCIERLSAEDMLLLVFSCHGCTIDNESYLVPANAAVGDTSRLISMSWIKELLDKCRAKFKVILVDACHAGDAKIGFKSGVVDFSFNETFFHADTLLRHSCGVAYATSCKHEQRAWILPNSSFSIWTAALCTAMEAAMSRTSWVGGIIPLEPVLAEAARLTVHEAMKHWSQPQTPYLLLKVEGVLPLGRCNAALASLPSRTSPDIGQATTAAFEERFAGTFGQEMEIEFERELQSRMSDHGYPLSRVVTIGPKGNRVRLGVLFDLMCEQIVGMDGLTKINGVAERLMLDRLVVPKLSAWDAKLWQFVAHLKRLHLVQLHPDASGKNRTYREFCKLADFDADTSLLANEFSDALLRKMGKLFHIVLADLAAATYDAQYGSAAFGTTEAMRYEDQLVYSVIAKLDQRELAVDLGCGTGRHTFALAKHFRNVEGHDFSPGMIEEANKKKRQADLDELQFRNVTFHVRDVEDHPIDYGSSSVDLIAACFGMGSFVENLVPFLVNIKDQLRPGGKAVISFYNRDALVYSTPPPWRDSSLTATLVPSRDELEVTLPTGDKFRVYCRSYTYAEVKGQLARIFDTVHVTSCPTFGSFLPNQYFSTGAARHKARQFISRIDRDLAENVGVPTGAYFTVICSKATGDVETPHPQVGAPKTEDRLLTLLRDEGVQCAVIEHDKVRNIADVQQQLAIEPSQMAKAILAIVRRDDKTELHVRHVVFVLPGSRRLDLAKADRLLELGRRKWRFATQKEVKPQSLATGGRGEVRVKKGRIFGRGGGRRGHVTALHVQRRRTI